MSYASLYLPAESHVGGRLRALPGQFARSYRSAMEITRAYRSSGMAGIDPTMVEKLGH